MPGILIYLAVGFVWGCFCAYVAAQKNREVFAWFLWGVLFWVIPMLALIAVPALPEPPPSPETSETEKPEFPPPEPSESGFCHHCGEQVELLLERCPHCRKPL